MALENMRWFRNKKKQNIGYAFAVIFPLIFLPYVFMPIPDIEELQYATGQITGLKAVYKRETFVGYSIEIDDGSRSYSLDLISDVKLSEAECHRLRNSGEVKFMFREPVFGVGDGELWSLMYNDKIFVNYSEVEQYYLSMRYHALAIALFLFAFFVIIGVGVDKGLVKLKPK